MGIMGKPTKRKTKIDPAAYISHKKSAEAALFLCNTGCMIYIAL